MSAYDRQGPWETAAKARLLRLAVLVMERGGGVLGEQLAGDALACRYTTLAEIARSVRHHVHTEDPPLDNGPASFRAFMRAIEGGQLDGERDVLPFDLSTPAMRFASLLRHGDTPDTSPIAARLVETVQLAMAEIATALASARDDAFVALPVPAVVEHLQRIGIADALAVRHGAGLGTVVQARNEDGRGFVLALRTKGWSAAMAEHDRTFFLARPYDEVAQALEVGGIGPEIVEVTEAPDGVQLRAKNYLGRNLVALVAVHSLPRAIRVVREIVDDQRATEAHRAQRDDERTTKAAPGTTISMHVDLDGEALAKAVEGSGAGTPPSAEDGA